MISNEDDVDYILAMESHCSLDTIDDQFINRNCLTEDEMYGYCDYGSPRNRCKDFDTMTDEESFEEDNDELFEV